MLAIYDNFSTGYKIVGLLHILSALVAFGPLFIYPSMQRAGAGAELAKMHLRVSVPALVLTWVLGIGLVGMSKDVFEMSQTWIVLSILLWVVLGSVSWFLIRPSLGDSGESAKAKLSAGVGATHLLVVVIIYLMVFKPGAPDGI